MGPVLNGLFLLAALLFFAVLFISTLRDPPPPEVLRRWRLGTFWAGPGLWWASGMLFTVSAVAGVSVAIAHGAGLDWSVAEPWLVGAAVALTLLAACSLCFSVVLYRRPPPPRPQGF